MSKTAIAAVPTVRDETAETRALIESAAAEWRGWVADGVSKTATAAYATDYAITSGWIKTSRKADDPGVETRTEFADRFGVTGAMVTRWARLGRAMRVHHVDPESPLFFALNSGGSTHEPIKNYLDGDTVQATPEDNVSHIAAMVDAWEDDKRKAKHTAPETSEAPAKPEPRPTPSVERAATPTAYATQVETVLANVGLVADSPKARKRVLDAMLAAVELLTAK